VWVVQFIGFVLDSFFGLQHGKGSEGHFCLHGGDMSLGWSAFVYAFWASAMALVGLGLFDFDIHIDRSLHR
jgi:hypothetical protein